VLFAFVITCPTTGKALLQKIKYGPFELVSVGVVPYSVKVIDRNVRLGNTFEPSACGTCKVAATPAGLDVLSPISSRQLPL
jgi:hypothetical protein